MIDFFCKYFSICKKRCFGFAIIKSPTNTDDFIIANFELKNVENAKIKKMELITNTLDLS